ncbi:MAG: hypothetical protein C4318_03500 [Acidimicrobiia bacterium]
MVEAGTISIDRADAAHKLTLIRRATVVLTGSFVLAIAFFANPLSKPYAGVVWLPTAFFFAVTGASLLQVPRAMPDLEKRFWRVLAFIGFFSSGTMLAFGLAGILRGSLASLSQTGTVPGSAWFLGIGSSGVVVLVGIACAAYLRSKVFFPEPHHHRLAALDVLSLGSALFAVQSVLAIPKGIPSIAWVEVLALMQIAGWSIAVAGAFVNFLHGHTFFEHSSRWIFLGCLCQSVATTMLMARILNAFERHPTGGSAQAALILIIGAAAFGEAFEADRVGAQLRSGRGGLRRELYPSLEIDTLKMAVRTDASAQNFKRIAGPFVSVAGPIVLAVILLASFSRESEATVVHRAIFYAGFSVSLTASVAKLAFERSTELKASAVLSSMLMGEKALVDEVLLAVDRERSAVATRIHDGLVQPLTASLLKLSHARMLLVRGDSETGTRLLNEGISSLSENIAEARGLVTTVYPPTLEQLGLEAALKELVTAYRRQGLAVEADWDWAGAVDRQVAVSIYRVANEALENALQHAHPKKARLRLAATTAGLELTVSDDGPGFREQSENEYILDGKLGIATMRRVAEMVGAWVDIETAGRTTVKMTIPSAATRSRVKSVNGVS